MPRSARCRVLSSWERWREDLLLLGLVVGCFFFTGVFCLELPLNKQVALGHGGIAAPSCSSSPATGSRAGFESAVESYAKSNFFPSNPINSCSLRVTVSLDLAPHKSFFQRFVSRVITLGSGHVPILVPNLQAQPVEEALSLHRARASPKSIALEVSSFSLGNHEAERKSIFRFYKSRGGPSSNPISVQPVAAGVGDVRLSTVVGGGEPEGAAIGRSSGAGIWPPRRGQVGGSSGSKLRDARRFSSTVAPRRKVTVAA